ncbi:MAG TPA: hypothetical protein VH877_02010 [Polyangia bacterium]|nr:hypothetical protein [Polyangia bacterium]
MSGPGARRGALALVVVAVLAGGRADAATSALDEARRHFDRLEYDQTLALLAEARRAAREAEEVAATWLLEGYVDVALDREEEARAAFGKALRLRPALTLPGDVSPKIRDLFEQVAAAERRRAERRTHAVVRLLPIEAPPVAERGFDVTAVVEEMAPGWSLRLAVAHRAIGLSAALPMAPLDEGSPSRAPSQRVAEQGRGEATGAEKTGEPEKTADPARSRFRVHLPREFARPGAMLECRVELLDEGDVIASAPEAPAMVAIPRHRAALRPLSPLVGASLSVDGRPAGRLPLAAPLPLEPGRHRVMLRAPGGVVTQEVDVPAGEVTIVTLALGPGTSPVVAVRWSLIAGGSALVVAGAAFAGATSVAVRNFENSVAVDPGTGLPTTPYSTAQAFERSARAFSTASIVTLVVGAVAVAVGGTLFLWHKRPAGAPRERPASSSSSSGAGAAARALLQGGVEGGNSMVGVSF